MTYRALRDGRPVSEAEVGYRWWVLGMAGSPKRPPRRGSWSTASAIRPSDCGS
ncbi:hypothetical protein NKH77_04465 [Streptomyces sp. M19]